MTDRHIYRAVDDLFDSWSVGNCLNELFNSKIYEFYDDGEWIITCDIEQDFKCQAGGAALVFNVYAENADCSEENITLSSVDIVCGVPLDEIVKEAARLAGEDLKRRWYEYKKIGDKEREQ